MKYYLFGNTSLKFFVNRPEKIEKKYHYNLWPGRYGNRLGNLKFIHSDRIQNHFPNM